MKRDVGQASVELLALVPLVVLLGWGVWQVALTGLTAGRAAHAARIGSRAAALGADAKEAIRKALPQSMPSLTRLKSDAGKVTVSLRVPSVIPGLKLGSVTASASFPRQR